MADYGKIPSAAKLQPKPFKAHVDDEKLQQFKQLIKLSPIGPQVWENSTGNRKYGMQRDWLINAKKHWETDYDWRKHEDVINSFPNFTATVPDDDGNELTVQFLALFSSKPDAIPIAFYHGWPGSILEFVGVLNLLKSRYSPDELPYHVVVPSLTGYAYSSGPPVDKNFKLDETARVMDRLMVGLGFESGYLAQGGDLGSFVSQYQANSCDSCKGYHLNMLHARDEIMKKGLPINELEEQGRARTKEFQTSGFAYAMEHGTRTGTIGLALSASPIAMLSWIGEKFLEWTDEDPTLDEILHSVSLYWLTDTFPRCIYPYRGIHEGRPPLDYINKPLGYSWFPKEIFPCPKSYAAETGNLVAFYQHDKGGHFAAMENPDILLGDVEDWVKKAWKP